MKPDKTMLFFIISGAVVLFDQIAKMLVRHLLTEGRSVKVIGNLVYFTYVRNKGAAFGIFQGARWILALISFAMAIFMLFELKFFVDNNLLLVGSALLFGGIIGNLIDRVFMGYVTDFIDLRVWPVFNIADTCIDIGLLIILVYFVFYGKDSHG